ncbi:CCC motif membrane protein [Abyssalbus ytuae]|uniref:DUF4190 domain-containing protein n=1 Tax=Abyssalbus ytuae TaxID=2926907 RepID=A0A9E6ZPM8_9FLAO|nr:CCC motif membrane protein [Abyssalbus ytuae]UOB18200.1 DUF4190 domain-containing protein [Abyssalbus ytuae]
MEKQKLPNETLILILGIASIVTCCCWGIGLILGIITLVLAKKDSKIFYENPDLYYGLNNLKTGKTLAIIGIILSLLYIIFAVYANVVYGEEEIRRMMEEWTQQMQNQ